MVLTSKKELYKTLPFAACMNVSERPMGIVNEDLRTASDHFDFNFSLTKPMLKCLMSNCTIDKSTLQ